MGFRRGQPDQQLKCSQQRTSPEKLYGFTHSLQAA